MGLVTILIALGLAMDSFSVSITYGLTSTKTEMLAKAMEIAFFFGLFQAIMPVIGWLAGMSIIDFISGFDHWLAFGLLAFIGSRMVYESLRKESKRLISSPNIAVLLLLSVATSIDALAVGLSLSFLKVPIVTPAALTGIVTFLLSFIGVHIGKRFGAFLGKRVGVLGGLILVGIGLNIVIEHLGISI